jgi:regulator of sigma E protease
MVSLIAHNLFSFIVILSIIVFIHEFGHYFVARLCKIKIEEFSIGFGKELFGFNDKNGTRWKFCILPFGGYVKMFGDKNPASIADGSKIKKFTKKEKEVSFYFQNVYKRIAVVSAGPIANFLLCIFLLTIIFKVQGLTTTMPIVDQLSKDGAAQEAGVEVGDKILKINNKEIKDFNEVRSAIVSNGPKPMNFVIQRQNEVLTINISPKITLSKNIFGEDHKIPLIGIGASQFQYQKLGLGSSFIHANIETYNLSVAVLKAIGELVTGQRSIKELSGPVKIAKYSGKSMSAGFIMVLWFMAMISVNLGVANLLPIPVLDGGHLFYYVIEAIKGKPLPEKVQQYGFQFGFAILLTLMLCTTYNDIYSIVAR